MSTSKTYQQSLANIGFENRPPMLERGSYIPWASRFRRYLNRKRDNHKWLLKALDEGPYEFKNFVPEGLKIPRLQTIKDLEGEALVSVYNRFAQLMNDLERNNINFPTVTINTKFLNNLQPEWLKYVTQVRLAKRLTVDSFDDLFDYLQQFEKLVNTSRAKKLEKSHDPLALVAYTGSSSRQTSSYYVTHPTSVVDYDDEYQQDDVHNNSEDPLVSAMLLLAKAITQNFSNPTNNRLRASSNTRNQAIIQGDRVNIQSRNSGNTGRNNRRAYVQEEVVEGMNAQNETGNVQRTLRTPSSGNTSTVQCYNCSGKGHYARNCPKPRVRDSKYFMEQMLLAKQDEAGVILTDEQNDFLFADASRMEEIKELSANICLMARIQPADHTSDDGPSYESAFIRNVNSGSVDKDTHVPDLCAVEKLARNAYQEAKKQRIFAKQVQTQNTHLTSQIEMYKERVRILEGIKQYIKQAISKSPKLYVASSLGNLEILLNVRDSEDILDDAFKSQQKMTEKMNDPIVVANKQSCWTINYKKLNALYEDFVPQKELSVEQKYFPSSSIPSVKILVLKNMPIKKKSFEIQEDLQARIKILEKDVQRCEKQSVDFQLKLQHEKEKQKWDSTSKNKITIPLDYSWISKMEKLEDENVSLDFTVQSLIKERDNAKMEYKKLFDSIKKTRSQTQKEMDELIVHVSEKTYAYGAIRAENQNLLTTISELKKRLEKAEKGKSVNTKFDKTNGFQSLLYVTPLNKQAFKKKSNVPKTEEINVVSKPVTLQTSPTKQTRANQNINVIRPGMYRVVTTQESQTSKTKSALSSTGMNATSRVRRPMSRDSHVAHSVLDNSKKEKRM
ncbi:retrovirus-related pol polyprotein from transposon TNT 1-94 [Tanacetum coccineum]